MNRLEPSPRESETLGLTTFRLLIEDAEHSMKSIPEAIAASDADLVIMRKTPSDASWLRSIDLKRWTAIRGPDNIEFGLDLAATNFQSAHDSVLIELYDLDQLRSLVATTFQGYRNHYSGNPWLPHVDSAEIYADWAANMTSSGAAIAYALVIDSDIASVAVVQVDKSDFHIHLAGTLPAFRRAGAYRELLSSLGTRAKDRGCTRLRIATQPENIRVLGAWIKCGLLPAITYETWHLMRKDLTST